MGTSDARRVERPRDRDDASELVVETGADLRRLARGLLYDASAADDVVQEAWLAALRGGIPSGWSPRAWLAGAVSRLARSRRRAEARRRVHEASAAQSEPVGSIAAAASRLDVAQRVVAAVQRLDEPYRASILARFFDDLSPRAIAQRDGVPVNSVKSRIARGLARVRRDLDTQHARHSRGGASERERFLAALAPLAGRPPWLLAAAASLGGTAMIGKTLVGTAAAAALVAALVWMGRGGATHRAQTEDAADAVAELRLVGAEDELSTGLEPAAAAGDRRAVPAGSAGVWEVSGWTLDARNAPEPGVGLIARLYAGDDLEVDPLLETRLASGADGRFRWRPPAPDRPVTLVVATDPSHDAARVSERRFALPGEPPPTDLVIEAFPIDSELLGRIVDEHGGPIAGASVGFWGDLQQTASGTNGEFRVRTSSRLSSQAVLASAPGFAQGRMWLTDVAPGARTVDDVVLRRAQHVVGRVVDMEGRAIAGATVLSGLGGPVRASADGAYELDCQPPDEAADGSAAPTAVWITAQAGGFAKRSVRCEIDGTPVVEQDIVLGVGGTVTGVVREGAGAPLAGVWVAAVELASAPRNESAVAHAHSGADGAFRLTNVPPGRYNLWAFRPGRARVRTPFTIRSDGEVLERDLVLEPGLVVAGRVVDAHGVAVPFANVTATRGDSSFDTLGLECRTGDAGRFRIDQLPEGTLDLTVYAEGFSITTQHVAAPGDEALVLVLQSETELHGRVVDGATGAPVKHFRVQRTNGLTGATSEDYGEFDDPEGRWSVAGVCEPNTPVQAEITADGYLPAQEARLVARVPADSEEVITPLFRATRVAGVVVAAATGEPIADARVRLYQRTQDRADLLNRDRVAARETRTGADGRFEIRSAASGVACLLVEHAVHPEALDGPFDVSANVQRRIEMAGGGALVGRVLDARGDPLADELVCTIRVANGVGIQDRSTRTDVDGAFRFDGLPAGVVTVMHRRCIGNLCCDAVRGSARVEDGAETSITLAPPGTARVTGALRTKGELPEVVVVRVTPAPESGLEPAELTRRRTAGFAREGRFEIDGLLPGSYIARASIWGAVRVSGEARFDVAEGGVADVVLELAARD